MIRYRLRDDVAQACLVVQCLEEDVPSNIRESNTVPILFTAVLKLGICHVLQALDIVFEAHVVQEGIHHQLYQARCLVKLLPVGATFTADEVGAVRVALLPAGVMGTQGVSCATFRCARMWKVAPVVRRLRSVLARGSLRALLVGEILKQRRHGVVTSIQILQKQLHRAGVFLFQINAVFCGLLQLHRHLSRCAGLAPWKDSP